MALSTAASGRPYQTIARLVIHGLGLIFSVVGLASFASNIVLHSHYDVDQAGRRFPDFDTLDTWPLIPLTWSIVWHLGDLTSILLAHPIHPYITIVSDAIAAVPLFTMMCLVIIGAPEHESGPWKENLYWSCFGPNCNVSAPIRKFYHVRKVATVLSFFAVAMHLFLIAIAGRSILLTRQSKRKIEPPAYYATVTIVEERNALPPYSNEDKKGMSVSETSSVSSMFKEAIEHKE